MTASLVQERLYDRLQPFVICAVKLLFRDEFAGAALWRNKRNSGFGATDIAHDQHQAGSFQNA
jgi:hypothetical protein